jgi:hypothetical protein
MRKLWPLLAQGAWRGRHTPERAVRMGSLARRASGSPGAIAISAAVY